MIRFLLVLALLFTPHSLPQEPHAVPDELVVLTKEVDAVQLAALADSVGIPRVVMWGVAWEESRGGDRGNASRGPGKILIDSITKIPRRVCREVGRMQLNPCIGWTRYNSLCTNENIRISYSTNILCGGLYLRKLYDYYGTWPAAIRHYNGSGPGADRYLERVLVSVGRYSLNIPNHLLTGVTANGQAISGRVTGPHSTNRF